MSEYINDTRFLAYLFLKFLKLHIISKNILAYVMRSKKYFFSMKQRDLKNYHPRNSNYRYTECFNKVNLRSLHINNHSPVF